MDKTIFLREHWGDYVGIFLIVLGIVVMFLVPGIYHGQDAIVQKIMDTGSSLVGAGLMALKLKPASGKTNGEENGNTVVNNVVTGGDK